MKKINVLSLFDGMSCGQIALERAGIKVENYFASEIDKYAIQVTQKNYPDTIQLGDVKNIYGTNVGLEVDSELSTRFIGVKIDLLIGGSPCQGFSFAGKQLNFNDPRSALFFEYVRILRQIRFFNPDVKFLLENVVMKKEYQDIITNLLGVSPITINSSLLSAQTRKRLYWTNIPNVKQPEDQGTLLKDIIEGGSVDRDKSHCLDASYYKGGNPKQYFEKSRRQLVFSENRPMILRDNVKTSDNGLIHIGTASDIKGNESIKRVYSAKGKCPTLTTMGGGHREPKINYETDLSYRKLTPVECERLQTVPDNYTNHVSNSQRYKMLGNGWTVDVIAHIFKNLK